MIPAALWRSFGTGCSDAADYMPMVFLITEVSVPPLTP